MKIMCGLSMMSLLLIGTSSWAQSPNADQCAALSAPVQHQANPDVSYRPSPDVVPADMDQSPNILQPHDPIKMDIKSVAGFPGSAGKPAREASFGQITVDTGDDGNARVLFNGRPLDDDTRKRLLAACPKK